MAPRRSKQKLGMLKLEIPAGKALPGPPIGPALGQHRLNIGEFCKQFNDRSQGLEPGSPCRTEISYYRDNSFTFEIKQPPVSYFLKQAAQLPKGSEHPGRESAGSVTAADLRRIAEAKLAELNTHDVEAAMRVVAGSARSMGIEIRG